MEPSFGPFGLLLVDLFKKLESEAVFFRVAFSLKFDRDWSKVYFLLGYILQLYLNKYSVFSLGPV